MVGAAPTGDAPTTSEWSTILLPTKVRLILETLRYMLGIWKQMIRMHFLWSAPSHYRYLKQVVNWNIVTFSINSASQYKKKKSIKFLAKLSSAKYRPCCLGLEVLTKSWACSWRFRKTSRGFIDRLCSPLGLHPDQQVLLCAACYMITFINTLWAFDYQFWPSDAIQRHISGSTLGKWFGVVRYQVITWTNVD